MTRKPLTPTGATLTVLRERHDITLEDLFGQTSNAPSTTPRQTQQKKLRAQGRVRVQHEDGRVSYELVH